MSYTINFTSVSKGTIIVNDSTFNTSSLPITLIGKSTANWGEIIQENLIHTLENFDNSSTPVYPTLGMLWSDNTTLSSRRLRLYDSTWKDVIVMNSSGSLPATGSYFGQIWGVGNILYFWNNLAWKKLDTDSLPLVGGTLTGNVISNNTPSNIYHLVNQNYVDGAITARCVTLISGGTVASNITLTATPTTSTHLTTKGYVDTSITTVNTSLTNYLLKSGGTLTGLLTLSGAPTSNLHAATKKYVDDSVVAIGSGLGYVPVNKAGDTMTGFLTLSANPTSNLHASTKQYVDTNALIKTTGGTVSGNMIFSGTMQNTGVVTFTNASTGAAFTKLPTSTATPTLSTELVTKTYVDSSFLSTATALTSPISYANTTVINNDYHLITRIFGDGRYLQLSGGTITGNITLSGSTMISTATAPTTDNHLVNRKYTTDTFLPLNGGTVAGSISLATAPTIGSHLTNKTYVDAQLSGATFTGGTLTLATFVPAPSGAPTDTQIINKKYINDHYVSRTPITDVTTITEEIRYESVFGNALVFASINNNTLISKQLLVSQLSSYLPLIGGTLTGALVLSGDPTIALHSATKQYVDSQTVLSTNKSNSGFYSTDFINGLVGTVFGTNISTTGVVARDDTRRTDALGVLKLSTGTNVAGAAEILDGDGIITPTNDMVCLIKIKIPIASTGSEEFIVSTGLVGGTSLITDVFVDSFRFVYDRTSSVNWIIKERQASSDTLTYTTSTAVTFGSWITLKVKYFQSLGLTRYYIDGTMVRESTGLTLTGAGYGFKTFIMKSVGTTSRDVLLDRVLYGKVLTIDTNWVI